MRASDKPTKLNTASDTRFMSRSVLECDENRQYQENSKKMKALRPIVLTSFLFLVVLAGAWQTQAQDRKARYPGMAPLDQYLMERDAEVILARSAAPQSISHDADVMVLGRHGYETAVKGKNGFVCMVERSWSAGFDDPDFWNPKVRGPDLLQRAGRTLQPSPHDQENRVNIVRAIQSSDFQRHWSRFRQEAITGA